MSNDKNYNFYFMKKYYLKSKNKFFVYMTNADLVAVQIINIFLKFFVTSKNFKIEHFKNHVEKKCYLTNSKNRHLTIIFNKMNF